MSEKERFYNAVLVIHLNSQIFPSLNQNYKLYCVSVCSLCTNLYLCLWLFECPYIKLVLMHFPVLTNTEEVYDVHKDGMLSYPEVVHYVFDLM